MWSLSSRLAGLFGGLHGNCQTEVKHSWSGKTIAINFMRDAIQCI